jgi:hypothetical protein
MDLLASAEQFARLRVNNCVRGGPPRRRHAAKHLPWDEAFANAWPCISPVKLQAAAIVRWQDPEYLSAHLPTVTVHESTRPTVQMCSLVQPFGALQELTWIRPWVERNISAAQLFAATEDVGNGGQQQPQQPRRQQQQARSHWPYFFSRVDHLPAPLRADLAGTLEQLSTPFLPAIEMNVWAGVPNVSSPLHYDVAHNVYAQIVGRKRFVLLPPEEGSSLYMHPRLHPSTRQSQIDLRDVEPSDFPKFERRFHRPGLHTRAARRPGAPAVVEAILEPGDRLYVPPYWWHRVSVDGSSSAVAVAVYSLSTPMRAYTLLKEHSLPKELRVGCKRECTQGGCCLPLLRTYLLALAALEPPGIGACSFVDSSFACAVAHRCTCFIDPDAYEWRHGALATENEEVCYHTSTSSASAEPGVEVVSELLETRYHSTLDDPRIVRGLSSMFEGARVRMRQRLSLASPALPTRTVALLHSHARALRERVAALPTRDDGALSPAIWRTEVGSLIEDVAAAMLGAREVEALLGWIVGRLR